MLMRGAGKIAGAGIVKRCESKRLGRPALAEELNGFGNLGMISARCDGQLVLITCFDGADLKRLSALCAERSLSRSLIEVAGGVRAKCHPLTWTGETR